MNKIKGLKSQPNRHNHQSLIQQAIQTITLTVTQPSLLLSLLITKPSLLATVTAINRLPHQKKANQIKKRWSKFGITSTS